MSNIVLSPQEKRIRSASTGSETRTKRILKRFQGTTPKIDIERGRYFTESFRETEGQPLVLRWAKALYHYAENATVYIDDDQLIAGRAGREGRYGILYPELDGDFLDEAIKSLPSRESSPFDITEEDANYIINEISLIGKEKPFTKPLQLLSQRIPKDIPIIMMKNLLQDL